ncbi:MAG: phosphoribosylformylglycinamidine synthase subunit PurS [Candidatus Aureabacteria bacterium]|nr:phosphoribosylformylglycinamidine synthase subunit PurS [Candidatus Auribacterota bacterium]
MFLAKVYVTLKKSVLDPQGVTVKHALESLDFESVSDVRLGKYMEIKLDVSDEEEAEARLKEMCKKLLINPVIEEYTYDLKRVGDC